MKNTLPFLLLLLIFDHVNAANQGILVGMVFDAESINSELVEYKSSINGYDHTRTDDEIKLLNRINNYKNYQFGTGVSFYVYLTKFLNLKFQGGLSFLKHETILNNNNELDHTFSNGTPGFFTGIGMSYNYNITQQFSVSLSPELKYQFYEDVDFTDPNNDFETYNNYNLESSFIYYNIPVIFKYKFNNLIPGIGFCYLNHIHHIDFNGIMIDDFNDEFKIVNSYTFHNTINFAIIVNMDYQINDYANIILNLYVNDGIATNLKFHIAL